MPATSVIVVAKYSFLCLVVSGAGYLISTITVLKHHRSEMLDDLVYNPQTLLTPDGVLLDRAFHRCMTRSSNPFCILSTNNRLSLHKPPDPSLRIHAANAQSTGLIKRHRISNALWDFIPLVHSVQVRPVLLEAAVLFCVLSPSAKIMLLTQGFRPHGSRTLITLSISQEESQVLDQDEFLTTALSSGFEVSRVRKWLTDEQLGTVHFFFTRQEGTIHLVVLIPKENYLWHSGHDYGELQDPNFDKDATYENFTVVLLKTEQSEVYLPSDPLHFLFQMHTSEFMNCTMSTEVTLQTHSTLSDDQLRKRALVAIQEIKAILRPLYVPFWIWAVSLNGWRDACNVFHYTSELNLAVTSLNDLNFSITLQDNAYLQHSWSDNTEKEFSLDCHGLRVNIFVVDQDGDSFQGNESKLTERRLYPKFRLCTTDVFGVRVHVPCELS